MACLKPYYGWRSKTVNPTTRKRSIVYNIREAYSDLRMQHACGRCIYCKKTNAREWAIRATHEASLYDNNIFVTLTYDPEHLPKNGSLNYKHPTDFMKRLREKYGPGIRSLGCAEYGTKGGRPHYHILIFNHDFPDKVKDGHPKRGNQHYMSQSLTELWGMGRANYGTVSWKSASYISKYISIREKDPQKVCKKYGCNCGFNKSRKEKCKKQFTKLPEKAICRSMRPGLGKPWFDKYKSDVYPSDQVVVLVKDQSKILRPPMYYDRMYQKSNPEEFAKIQLDRRQKAMEKQIDTKRAMALEKFQEIMLNKEINQRDYDNGT